MATVGANTPPGCVTDMCPKPPFCRLNRKIRAPAASLVGAHAGDPCVAKPKGGLRYGNATAFGAFEQEPAPESIPVATLDPRLLRSLGEALLAARQIHDLVQQAL